MAYSDNFNDGTIDAALWSVSTSGTASITESSGTLNFSIHSVFADATIQTITSFNLTTTTVFIEFTQLTLGTGGQAIPLSVYEKTLFQSMSFIVYAGNIYALSNYGPSGPQGSMTYNSVTHRWLRLTPSGSNVLYQYSADGLSWTTMYTQAVASQFSTAYTIPELIDFDGNGSLSTMSLDNFNIAPAATTTSTSSTSSSTSTSSSISTSSTSSSISTSSTSTSRSTSTSSTSTSISTSSTSSSTSTSISTSTSTTVSYTTSTSSTSTSISTSSTSSSTSQSTSTSTTLVEYGFIPVVSISKSINRFKLISDKPRSH